MVCKRAAIGASVLLGGYLLPLIALLILHRKLKREEKKLEEEHERAKNEAAKEDAAKKATEAAAVGAAAAAAAGGPGASGENTTVTKANPATGQAVTQTVAQGSSTTVQPGHTAEVVTTGGPSGTTTQEVAPKPVEQVVEVAAKPTEPVVAAT